VCQWRSRFVVLCVLDFVCSPHLDVAGPSCPPSGSGCLLGPLLSHMAATVIWKVHHQESHQEINTWFHLHDAVAQTDTRVDAVRASDLLRFLDLASPLRLGILPSPNPRPPITQPTPPTVPAAAPFFLLLQLQTHRPHPRGIGVTRTRSNRHAPGSNLITHKSSSVALAGASEAFEIIHHYSSHWWLTGYLSFRPDSPLLSTIPLSSSTISAGFRRLLDV
jgi:hypothetical protein